MDNKKLKSDKIERSELLQLLFLLVIMIFIVVMIITLVTLIKNKDVIILDPLNYGMKVHNFTSCSCFDSSGNFWESRDKGFVKKNSILYGDYKWDNQKF